MIKIKKIYIKHYQFSILFFFQFDNIKWKRYNRIKILINKSTNNMLDLEVFEIHVGREAATNMIEHQPH